MTTMIASTVCAALAAMYTAAALPVSDAGKSAALSAPKNVPALMKTFGGADVKTREDWENIRAPELFARFERDVYGRRPAAAEERGRVSFETYRESEAFGGKAICKHVRVKYDGPNGKHTFPITAYIPKTGRPAPAFVYIAIDFHTKYDADGAVTTSEYWPVEQLIDRGYATAAFSVIRVAADKGDAGFSQGIFPAVQPESARGPDSWATISAWAWGASRVMDWIETEPLIDAKHVGAVGHSRGGKTALWAGATDKRFAMVCSNESGCGGAKLNHIELPKSESIDVISGPRRFHYWFCRNFRAYAGKEMEMDFDQHELIALMAPRLVCVGSATKDNWAGQLGEWWAAKLASPAWELYGKKGLVGDKWPNPETPQQEGCISYHLRTGEHFLRPYDWGRYMDFADKHGWRWKSKGIVVAAPAPKDVGRFCSFIKDTLKPSGVDTIVLLVRYRYQFTSHPECVGNNALSLADVKSIKAACDAVGVKLIPKMNLLGHQGERNGVVRDGLLKGHPELDESPEKKKVIRDYCRSICPTHPDSKRIVLDLVDELVAAFGADMMHIGCDEVFEIGNCPRCRGTATAKLFADWVNGIADHLKAKGVGVMMWGDRLLDSKAMGYGVWEASDNGTSAALGKVNRDIVICDWHYSIRKAYPSVDAFADAGYKMYLCPWRYVESTRKFLEYAMAHDKGQYLGVLLTTWCSCEDFMDVVEGKGVTRHKSDSKSAKTLEALRGNFRYIFPKATSRN